MICLLNRLSIIIATTWESKRHIINKYSGSQGSILFLSLRNEPRKELSWWAFNSASVLVSSGRSLRTVGHFACRLLTSFGLRLTPSVTRFAPSSGRRAPWETVSRSSFPRYALSRRPSSSGPLRGVVSEWWVNGNESIIDQLLPPLRNRLTGRT